VGLGGGEVGDLALDGVHGAAGFLHGGFVAILPRPTPPPVDQVLIILSGHCVRPHAVAEVRVLVFAVATAVTFMLSKILNYGAGTFTRHCQNTDLLKCYTQAM